VIYEFFVNACILMTFITLVYLFFKDIRLSDNKSLTLQIGVGLYGGAVGIILLVCSVNIGNNTIIDFRYIPLLLSAIYFGAISTIIATVIIGGFRVLYFGISEPAIIASITTLVVGMGFGFITKLKISKYQKWMYSTMFSIFASTIALRIIIKSSMLFLKVGAIFWISYLVVSFIIFHYTQNLYESIKLQRVLKKEAKEDHLTGLNNLRQFESILDNFTYKTLKEKKLSLLFIDIDYFKKINDTYGHIVGDKILKELAEILIETFGENDIISRNGGEEFSVLLIDSSVQQAMKIAEKLRGKVEGNIFTISDELDLRITISIGVSTYPDTTKKIEELLNDADCALYEAKISGRGKVVLYEIGNCLYKMNS
jgi:diguanylate cyclase